MTVLIDNQAYFRAARAALEQARDSVILLGWTFDPRTQLDPERGATEADTIGELLNRLARERPGVDIRLLIWDSALPISAVRGLFPQRARFWLDPAIRLHLDSSHPLGACHHQKLLIVDDALAFCAGGDFSPERWDRPTHLDRDPLRRLASGRMHEPRHGMTAMVDGDAARALGELARERWRRATGERLTAAPPQDAASWPDHVQPWQRDVELGIVLTQPAFRDAVEIHDCERLFVEAIAAAREAIYIENQYFAAPLIADALAARLAEPDGPEVLVVCTPHSPSYFDRWIMDAARDATIAHLIETDRHRRFRCWAPHAPGGQPVIVHSKAMIVDDRFARLGSANLNNRSMGLDTECDLAFQAGADEDGRRDAVRRLRDRLIAHFLGISEARFAREAAARGSLIAAVEALDGPERRRLQPLEPAGAGLLGSATAWPHLGDPETPADSWRPWRRRTGPAKPPWVFAAGLLGATAAVWAVLRRLRGPKGP